MMQAFKLLALFPLVALSVDFDDYGNDDYRFYDVCEEFSFTSCDFCFANADCFWCPKDGACTSYKGDTWWSCALSDYPDACSDEVNIFSDPLYSAQSWVYDQINVLPVWEEGILGTGVRVRVNDDGILVSHPEFAGKFDSDASCDVYLPDSFTLEENSHGTAVASILAANANNGECAVGIAPGVTLSACNMFLERSIDIELLGTKLHKFDISQNSWGPVPCQPLERRRLEMFDVCPFVYQGPDFDSPCDICDFPISSSSRSEDCELAIKNHCTNYYEHEPTVCLDFWDLFIQPCKYATLSVSAQEAFAKGIREGRDGKGIIYVFASGNEHGEGSNVNFDGIMSSRFTIVVGGTSKADGQHSHYSSTGAAMFISAPGGDQLDTSVNHIAASINGGCYDAGQGTSFACPVVSGVIALMLETRPELGWRDVQGILAKTARKVNDLDNDWVTNAAGINHSYYYGFGIVDAHAAVTMAKSWELYGPEKRLMGQSGIVNLPLVDNSSQRTVSTLTIESSSVYSFIAESVVAYVYLRHISRGDLTIVLTSPHGTESILIPGNRPENTQLTDEQSWKMLSLRTWGEDALGEWKIEITDVNPGYAFPCADKPWAPTFYSDGCPIECYEMEQKGLCANGYPDPSHVDFDFILKYKDDGLTFVDACCDCGGGYSSEEAATVDKLIQWRLMVYGRSDTTNQPPTDSKDVEEDPSQVPSTGLVSFMATDVVMWTSIASIALVFIFA